MKTRCKFHCCAVEKREGWGDSPILYATKMSAVGFRPEDNEDRKFFAASPAGSFEVSTVLVPDFEVGKDYYFDISEVMPAEPREKETK